MSGKANDLIERAEREAGCRWDDPDNPSALAILFGAVARKLGKSKFDERDDFAVGMLLMNQDNDSDLLLEQLLRSGMDPKDIFNLLK